jgi:hypothetical protein
MHASKVDDAASPKPIIIPSKISNPGDLGSTNAGTNY